MFLLRQIQKKKTWTHHFIVHRRMSEIKRTDLVIIGGGPAGLTAAIYGNLSFLGLPSRANSWKSKFETDCCSWFDSSWFHSR